MGTLGVDPSGLQAWSTQCGSPAGTLAAPVAALAGPAAQATSAAVIAEQDAEGSQRLAAVPLSPAG